MTKIPVCDLDHDTLVGLLKVLVHRAGNTVEILMPDIEEIEDQMLASTLYVTLSSDNQDGTLTLETN